MFNFKKDQEEKHRFLVLQSVGISVAATLFLLLVFFLLVYVNRVAILGHFVTQYVEGNVVSESGEKQQLGPYLSEDSRIVKVVDEAIDSVVSIAVSKEVPNVERKTVIGPFGFPQSELQVKGTEKQIIGAGSGFIVSKDGLVVTNKHVVSDEDAEYTVITASKERYKATVVARDPFIDIAILKIESNKIFDPLAFGNSQALELGQTVIAIGNALGEFQNTVSVGVVSGLSRSIVAQGQMGAERLDRVIQTDAALNPGNSGGPLLALSGKIIGVNVAIAGGSENIAFAIPSEFVKGIVESVKKTGEIIRPFLGVRYVSLSHVNKSSSIAADHGALVFSGTSDIPAVLPGSPADKAGIRNGDIILAVDGRDVTVDQSLGLLIREKGVGEKVQLTVLHDGNKKNVFVTLEEVPDGIES